MRWTRITGRSGDKTDFSRFSDGSSTVPDDVLAFALEDLEAGLTPLQVLQRYPAHEAELAALLQTAYELRTTRWPAISVAGRVAGRERMHAALAAQKRRGSGFLPPLWRQVGVTLALALIAGAAFLASPYSPLDRLGKGGAATPTAGAPALAAPTSTFTVPPSASVTASATISATPRPVRSVEPTEMAERLILAEPTRILTSTPAPTLTATRRPTRVETATPAPTATPSVSVIPATTGQGAESAPPSAAPATEAPTQPPSPTAVPPTTTPSPVPPKPSPTVTVAPTIPEPTVTSTPVPPTPALPTATTTRQPSPTVTPKPTETDRPPHPRLSQTPEPTRTPRRTGAANLPVLIKVNEQRLEAGALLPAVLPQAIGPRGRRP